MIFAASLFFLIVSLILNYITAVEILPSGQTAILRNMLWIVMGVIGITAVCLPICFAHLVRRDSRVREEQLGQVRYMLEVEKKLFDAYQKPELFAEALHQVASSMNAERAYFMILKDSSILRLYGWDRGENMDTGELSGVYAQFRYPYLMKKSRESGSQIIYDMEELKGKSKADYDSLTSQGIENLIFTPVRGLDQKTIGILVAANMKRKWKNAGRMECVALSFGMAFNNRTSFQAVKRMGEVDYLTGLLNRNSLERTKKTYGNGSFKNLACVFLDADGLHELNNHLGHAAGDAMLMQIADCLKQNFGGQDIYRIGGDEFLVICRDTEENYVLERLQTILRELEEEGYHVSSGVEWRDDSLSVERMIAEAERKMYEEKHDYYQKKGDIKRVRKMNDILERILREKRDADALLALLSSNFKGVYFVDLNTDSIRSIYIPEYFEKMLKDADGKYSVAMENYIDKMVMPTWQEDMKHFLDFETLSKILEKGEIPELEYEKTDGSRVLLKIFRSEDYSEEKREMIWLFRKREDA